MAEQKSEVKDEKNDDGKKADNIYNAKNIKNNYETLANTANDVLVGSLFAMLDNDQIDKLIQRIDNEENLQKRAKEFKTNRFKSKIGSPESDFRTANQKDIQNKRWKWYEDNIEIFKIILRNNGFDFEDIVCSVNGTKPIGMKIGLFNDFKKELFKSIKTAKARIHKEFGQELNFRVVLQGSYIVGWSSNPYKGERYIPTYLFDPTKGSDYDFRIYADGLDSYVEKLRNDGVEIQDRSVYIKELYYMILPKSVAKIFPEFKELQENFAEMTRKNYNGKEVRLQISVTTKDIDFDPFPWDMEIQIQ